MKVEITDNCISCGACVAVNSEVFGMDEIAYIHGENIDGNEDDCRFAADSCPVGAIHIIEE